MIESWPFGIFSQVFSAFGFVHKIATFEKAAGFQVWCQLHWIFLRSHLSCYIFLTPWHSLGLNPVQRFWDCICSKECLKWKKHTQVCPAFVPRSPLDFNKFGKGTDIVCLLIVFWWFTLGICFQSMLIHVTCEFHILHTLIWISSSSLTEAGNNGIKRFCNLFLFLLKVFCVDYGLYLIYCLCFCMLLILASEFG